MTNFPLVWNDTRYEVILCMKCRMVCSALVWSDWYEVTFFPLGWSDSKNEVTIGWSDWKPYFTYQNGKRNNIYALGEIENKTSTYMASTHAILNSEWCFKNRILMVLDLYIPRFGVIHWITFNIEIVKICPWKKLWRFWLPEFNQNIVRVSLIKLAVHGHPFQFFWTTIFCSSAILGLWAKIRRSGSTTEGTTVVPFWNCSKIIHRNDM